MPIFYKGAGPGTHWNVNDATVGGVTAHSPSLSHSPDRVVRHIIGGSTFSPYTSLTRSYAVAWDYALHAGSLTVVATKATPGYVYVIDIPDPLPPGLVLFDPVVELGGSLSSPGALVSYQHDGSPQFLIGVVSPRRHRRYRVGPCVKAPPAPSGPPSAPSPSLETMVCALRDAEILAMGPIPAASSAPGSPRYVTRHPVP
jgi:hypothetical protein